MPGLDDNPICHNAQQQPSRPGKNDTGTCTQGKIPRGIVTVDIDTPMQGITCDCLLCVTPMAVSKASNQSLF